MQARAGRKMRTVIGSLLVMIAAYVAIQYWGTRGDYDSCIAAVENLKSDYEQNRPREGHFQIEGEISRARELCEAKNYGEANSAVGRALLTCKTNRGCRKTSG